MDEKEKVPVILKPRAEQSIVDISIFIAGNGNPERALSFMDSLYEFGYSLSIFPNKYPICKKLTLAKRNLHCAVFDKNYIFIYKVHNKRLVVYNVINARTYNL